MVLPVLRKTTLIIAAATAIGAVILTGLTLSDIRTLPNDLEQLVSVTLKPQLLDRDGRPLTITYQNEWNTHSITPLHRVPEFLQGAFILAEDKRFYDHNGIDWLARLNAVWQNLTALDGVRGASTISEQVVRMIHKRPRSVWAKWVEGWEARALEATFDKATILEFYLNQVPYAAQRRGVQQASNYYFDRDISTLNDKEMLALAVLVRAPSHFDLYKSTTRLEGRLNTLLERATTVGLVSKPESVLANTLSVTKPQLPLNVSHFAKHIYRNADTLNGESRPQQIKTTLNSKYQRLAQSLLNQRLVSLKSRQVSNAGMIVVDHQNDEVLVWAVGQNMQNKGGDYDTNLVKRQPGSTLKPFVYASAIEKGWTAATMIDDSPLNEGVGQGVHSYRNYSNRYYGELSLRNALGNSLNIPAIKAAKFVGVDPLINTLNKLGVHDLNLRSVDYGNGLALGNGEISLHSLVGAYAALARQGVYRPLKTIAAQTTTQNRAVFTPEVSSIVSNILSDPGARALEFGHGGALHLPVQTAVKTGTSNDFRDAWVMGYNHRYVVGIWMGNLDNQPMDRVTGSSGPAFVLRSMFAELNRNTETQTLFLSRNLVQAEICIDNGLDANNPQNANKSCATRNEWFRPNRLAKQSTIHPSQATAVEERYKLAHPIDQMLVARDPRIPDDMEALEFKLNLDAGVHKVEWFVNGKIVASTSAAKYYWPLEAGLHVVSAKVYDIESAQPTHTQRVSMLIK